MSRKSYISVTLAALCLVIASCSKQDTSVQDGGYGWIDVEMNGEFNLKGATPLAPEDYSKFTLSLYRQNELQWSENLASFDTSSHRRNPAGTYTLKAFDITPEQAEEGRGRMRLAGENLVTVRAGRTVVASLECTPSNAKVSIDFDDKFKSTYNQYSASVTNGTRSFEMGAGHTDANAVYYNVGADGTLTLQTHVSGTSAEGSDQFARNVTLPAGKWTRITYSVGTNARITVTISLDDSMNDVKVDETIDPVL